MAIYSSNIFASTSCNIDTSRPRATSLLTADAVICSLRAMSALLNIKLSTAGAHTIDRASAIERFLPLAPLRGSWNGTIALPINTVYKTIAILFVLEYRLTLTFWVPKRVSKAVASPAIQSNMSLEPPFRHQKDGPKTFQALLSALYCIHISRLAWSDKESIYEAALSGAISENH